MGKKISLGAEQSVGTTIVTKSATLEERVAALQRHIEELAAAFHAVNSIRIKDKRQSGIIETNKTPSVVLDEGTKNYDGIPIGIALLGISSRNGTRFLTVEVDGYYIGSKRFDTLSAAAEYTSGVRRSGWTFWKLPDGRTVKEAFGR